MSSSSQPKFEEDHELESAVDQAISACGGDMRATIRALIVANEYLETEVGELMRRSRTPMRGAGSTPIRGEGPPSGRPADTSPPIRDRCLHRFLLYDGFVSRVPAWHIAGEDPAQKAQARRTCSKEF